jgi:hypothetical protein
MENCNVIARGGGEPSNLRRCGMLGSPPSAGNDGAELQAESDCNDSGDLARNSNLYPTAAGATAAGLEAAPT